MLRRSIVSGLAAAVALVAAAGSAHATFFSFASDVNSNSFTFGGTAGNGAGSFSLTDFARPNTYTLLIDDDNGPAPTKSLAVEFRSNLTVSSGASTAVGGPLYQHSYRVLGTFGFYDMMGNALLTVNIGPSAGILTVPGTQNAWSTSGAVLGSDSFADVSYTASQAFVNDLGGAAMASQYGIAVGTNGFGTSVGPDDFSFSLSVINAGSIGATVLLDPLTHAPTSTWRSESSFSGSAFSGIPAPGACGLAGLGLAFLARRVRR